ncbi:MAG: hypothetical protein RXR36_02430 [Nitrososphaeria archaeon]
MSFIQKGELSKFLNLENIIVYDLYNRNLTSDFGDEVVPLYEIINILKPNENDIVLSIGDINGYYSLVLRKYAKEVHVLVPEDLWFEYIKRLAVKFGAKNVIPHKEDPCTNISLEKFDKFFIKAREMDLECISSISKTLIKQETVKSGIIIGVHSPPFYRTSDLLPEAIENTFKDSGFSLKFKVNFRYHYAMYFSK